MQANTEAIVRLAWSRRLGLADDALADESPGRVECQSDCTLMIIRLWRREVVVGPSWFLERTRPLAAEVLADGSRLLSLSADHGGRLLGAATLAFTDDYVSDPDLATTVFTDDPAAVIELEKRCPPDDVAEVRPAELARCWVGLNERDEPTACAGYDEWQGILAHTGVLTAPAVRRRGLGSLAAAVATDEALDAGLVPQWRSRIENTASRALARRLGYIEVGSQTTVVLPAAVR